MTAPDKIYLQWADDDDDDYREITWCVDQIEETDVEYSRITLKELVALRRVKDAARYLFGAVLEKRTNTELLNGLGKAIAEYEKVVSETEDK